MVTRRMMGVRLRGTKAGRHHQMEVRRGLNYELSTQFRTCPFPCAATELSRSCRRPEVMPLGKSNFPADVSFVQQHSHNQVASSDNVARVLGTGT